MDELERIKKLAGLYDNPNHTEDSMGENLSYIGTKKSEYQRKHNINRVKFVKIISCLVWLSVVLIQ